MKYKIQGRTWRGGREENEDNFMLDRVLPFAREDGSISDLIIDDGCFHLIAVADGVGGAQAGKIASTEVLKSLNRTMKDYARVEGMTLERLAEVLLDNANEAIVKKNQDLKIRMATTISILLWNEADYIIGNIGDSPVFCLHAGEIRMISQIQTVGEQKRAAGEPVLPGDENTLVHYCGKTTYTGSEMAAFYRGFWEEGDLFLLCSDGITKEMTISDILVAFHSMGKGMDSLWSRLSNNPEDNCTALLLNVTSDDEMEFQKCEMRKRSLFEILKQQFTNLRWGDFGFKCAAR